MAGQDDVYSSNWDGGIPPYTPGLEQIHLHDADDDEGSPATATSTPMKTKAPAKRTTKSKAAKAVAAAAAVTADEGAEHDEGGGRTRHSYTVEETDIICRIWMEETNDAIRGTDQKHEHYWKRVVERVNLLMSTKFGVKQIKSHFQRVGNEVKAWENAWVEAHANWPSGFNDDMMRNQTMELYKSRNKGVPFRWENSWRLLRLNHKFKSQYLNGDVHASKRTKTSSDGAFTTSASAEESVGTRLIGNKAAKAEAKGKGKTTAPSSELLQFIEGTQNGLQALAEAKMEKIRMKREAMDNKILYMDTSRMTEEQLKLHSEQVFEILARRANG